MLPNVLATFSTKCCKELSKIAQSGHIAKVLTTRFMTRSGQIVIRNVDRI